MRGETSNQDDCFSYVPLEKLVPADHPLRGIRVIVDRALKELSETFDEMYANRGRNSIPPEQLIRALLIQILYGVRSERQLVEQLNYNLLFRWFVGLRLSDEEVRLFTGQLARILDYVRQIESLDTEGTEPLAHALPVTDVLREDEPHEGLSEEQALSNAPDTQHGFFRVPPVLDPQSGA